MDRWGRGPEGPEQKALPTGTFCNDGDVLYLPHPAWFTTNLRWLLSTQNVAYAAEKLDFSFYVILINLKGHMWPVATVFAQCWPTLREVSGQPQVTEVLKQPRCPGQPADPLKACGPPGQFTDLPVHQPHLLLF